MTTDIKDPTTETYENLQFAYQYYNEHLFGDSLPNCVITLNRRKNTLGYFVSRLWEDTEDQERSDEISLNPTAILHRGTVDVLSTLVHEMCHLWRAHFGKTAQPKQPGYHCKEWGRMMVEVGLQPSSTGQPGGKTTGKKMDHYIIEGGEFEVVTKRLIEDEGWVFPYVPHDAEEQKAKKKAASKTKFTCPSCEANAWGKPDLRIICKDCDVEFEPEIKEEDKDDEPSVEHDHG